MAVVRKHIDPGHRYEPEKELTGEQLQRFSDMANKAEVRREQRKEYEALLHPDKAKRVRKVARPVIPARVMAGKSRKPRRRMTLTRFVVWSVVLWLFWSWVMFMFPV